MIAGQAPTLTCSPCSTPPSSCLPSSPWPLRPGILGIAIPPLCSQSPGDSGQTQLLVERFVCLFGSSCILDQFDLFFVCLQLLLICRALCVWRLLFAYLFFICWCTVHIFDVKNIICLPLFRLTHIVSLFVC